MKNNSPTIAKFTLPLYLLQEIIPGSKFIGKLPNKNLFIEGCSIDSRTIEKNFFFLAIKGKNFDGHSFIKNVKDNGAILAVVDKKKIDDTLLKPIDENFFILAVEEVIQALSFVAAFKRGKWKGKLLTVTGSNGKTTAKEIISNILSINFGEGSQFKTYGNQNNHIGVPLNLLRIKNNNKFAVIEMGMNNNGEISKLSSIVKPNLALITNAQREHQEYLGSVRATAIENGSVISHLRKGDVVVFPKDKKNEDIWWELAKENNCEIIRFSLLEDNTDFDSKNNCREIICEIVNYFPLKIRLTLGKQLIGETTLRGFGRHFARTATAAAAACIGLKIPNESIINGLKSFTPLKGRGYFYYLKSGGMIVDDSYNANPDSMEAAINAMIEITGRRAMILGDMGELGKDSFSMHVEVLRLAARNLDDIFLFGENFSKANSSLKCGKVYSSLRNLENDIRKWMQKFNSQPNTFVLWVKGSRVSNLDLIVKNLVTN